MRSDWTVREEKPVVLSGRLAKGVIQIVETAAGERFRFTPHDARTDLEATVVILRPNTQETLPLSACEGGHYESNAAPGEPHEFSAELRLRRGDLDEVLPFSMTEPHAH